MKLIVGLGNPEAKYDGTRHNVGFMVADALAKELDTEFNKNLKKAVLAQGLYNGEKIFIAKPQTYMNLSGESIVPLADYYKIPIEDVLVIVDDVNLELGNIRLRSEGSAGGHNGLKNIILNFASDKFARLRVGVGSPEGNLIGYVLGKIPKEEKKHFEKIIDRSVEAALTFCKEGIDAAMNKYNCKNKGGDDAEI